MRELRILLRRFPASELAAVNVHAAFRTYMLLSGGS